MVFRAWSCLRLCVQCCTMMRQPTIGFMLLDFIFVRSAPGQYKIRLMTVVGYFILFFDVLN